MLLDYNRIPPSTNEIYFRELRKIFSRPGIPSWNTLRLLHYVHRKSVRFTVTVGIQNSY